MGSPALFKSNPPRNAIVNNDAYESLVSSWAILKNFGVFTQPPASADNFFQFQLTFQPGLPRSSSMNFKDKGNRRPGES